MHSKWIEHQGKKIFYQDFSNLHHDSAAFQAELDEVQKIVIAKPLNSVLVLADFRDTNLHPDFITSLTSASRATKSHVNKTAVLGVTGAKRTLADLFVKMTGQDMKYFDNLEEAKQWLAED